jgi:hypothetical protein
MTSDSNPATQPSTTATPSHSTPALNWGGRLVLGLIFAVGVAFLIYIGLVIGMFVGLGIGAEVMENTPHRNTGMAPDLTGLVNGTFAFAKSAFVGAVAGLIVGLFAMWAACRYLLAPLFRRTRLFTTNRA